MSDKWDEYSGGRLLVLHSVCFLLVVVYVNMYQFWAWLSLKLGAGLLANMLPIFVTLVVLFCVSFYFARRINSGYRIQFIYFGLGVVGAFLSLAIPDPNVPIKRIHVAEYIILSFLVRYVLSKRLAGAHLLFFTIVVTALYGIHDEMLQGLHSLRYYGWRDMIVNASAGLSGAFLGHGLLCCDNNDRYEIWKQSVSGGQWMAFGALMAGVIWQIIYLYHHRSESMSLYIIFPVLICCIALTFICPKTIFNSKEHHGLQATFWLAFALISYPVLAETGWWEFL